MEILFERQTSSSHQTESMRKMGKGPGLDIVFLAWKPGSTRRLTMVRNSKYDYGRAEQIDFHGVLVKEMAFNDLGPGSIRIFSGMGRDPCSRTLVRHASRNRARFGFYLEPWRIASRAKSLPMELMYHCSTKRIRRDRPLSLNTAPVGREQLLTSGVGEASIYPFAYFLSGEVDLPKSAVVRQSEPELNIICVGSLNVEKSTSKAANILLDFVFDVCLNIVGSGPDEEAVLRLEETATGRFILLGSNDNHVMKFLISLAGYLMLPSMFDGWGAVVSEAVLVGTRNIPDRSGASQVVNLEVLGISLSPTEQEMRAALQSASKTRLASSEDPKTVRGQRGNPGGDRGFLS